MSTPATPPEVEVRRSRRRRRTVSAYRDGDRIVVLIPAAMSKRDEATWVADMVARIERQEKRRLRSDDELSPAPPSSTTSTSAASRCPRRCGG